uniref:Uncharacterized protein n=1 Tax=Anguilla anguilla TaxID=7936 RepID=A0A0E9XZ04_ANGAN
MLHHHVSTVAQNGQTALGRAYRVFFPRIFNFSGWLECTGWKTKKKKEETEWSYIVLDNPFVKYTRICDAWVRLPSKIAVRNTTRVVYGVVVLFSTAWLE